MNSSDKKTMKTTTTPQIDKQSLEALKKAIQQKLVSSLYDPSEQRMLVLQSYYYGQLNILNHILEGEPIS